MFLFRVHVALFAAIEKMVIRKYNISEDDFRIDHGNSCIEDGTSQSWSAVEIRRSVLLCDDGPYDYWYVFFLRNTDLRIELLK